MEEGIRGVNWAKYPDIAWSVWEIREETLNCIVGFPAKFGTAHFPNASLDRYHYSNVFLLHHVIWKLGTDILRGLAAFVCSHDDGYFVLEHTHKT